MIPEVFADAFSGRKNGVRLNKGQEACKQSIDMKNRIQHHESLNGEQ